MLQNAHAEHPGLSTKLRGAGRRTGLGRSVAVARRSNALVRAAPAPAAGLRACGAHQHCFSGAVPAADPARAPSELELNAACHESKQEIKHQPRLRYKVGPHCGRPRGEQARRALLLTRHCISLHLSASLYLASPTLSASTDVALHCCLAPAAHCPAVHRAVSLPRLPRLPAYQRSPRSRARAPFRPPGRRAAAAAGARDGAALGAAAAGGCGSARMSMRCCIRRHSDFGAPRTRYHSNDSLSVPASYMMLRSSRRIELVPIARVQTIA